MCVCVVLFSLSSNRSSPCLCLSARATALVSLPRLCCTGESCGWCSLLCIQRWPRAWGRHVSCRDRWRKGAVYITIYEGRSGVGQNDRYITLSYSTPYFLYMSVYFACVRNFICIDGAYSNPLLIYLIPFCVYLFICLCGCMRMCMSVHAHIFICV